MNEPLIASAAVTPGHDGLAEISLDIRYPNGAERTISFTHDSIGQVLDAAGVTCLDDLVGRPWSILLT
jgi:hypothetical protein